MKKLLLLLVLLSTNIIFSQGFNQPTQFNNVCDDNNDGIALFYLQEISYEILSGFNTANYTVTHHLTQTDASTGANALGNDYVNVSNPQLIFAQVVNNLTNELQIITYNLYVHNTPVASPQTLTGCENNGMAIYDLLSTVPVYSNGNQNLNVTFHLTLTDAQTNSNPLDSYFSTIGSIVLYVRIEDATTGCYTVTQLYLTPINCNSTTCDAPVQLYATSISETTAAIDWTEISNASQWEISISANGVSLPINPINVTSHPYTISGLNCNTTYTFSVRSICSPTQTSTWSAAGTFQTLPCSSGANSCGTVFTDPAGANANYANNANITTTICPDTSTDVVTVTFTAFNLENNYDFLRVYNGTSATAPLIASYTGTTLPSAVSSSTPGGCLTFVFTSDGSVTAAGWVANVTCAPAPTCLAPNNLAATNISGTTATISWNNNNNSTNFEVLIVPCGTPAPTASSTGTAINSNTFTATTLLSATCYTVYVRSICSNTDYSFWSAGLTFTTAIAPPACGGIFTDPAGANTNYANNTDYTVTICPTNPGEMVTVTFTQFNTEANWDGLYVYNGNSTSSPQISSTNGAGSVPGGVAGSYWGTTIPGPFTSSSPDGCLTFRFRSDNSVTAAGWVANVTCTVAPSRLLLVAFIDSNGNNIMDTNESYFHYGSYATQQNNSGTNTYITPTSGYYSIYDSNPANMYDVSFEIDPLYASYYSVGTSSYNDVTIPAGSGTTTLYFPITVLQNYSDVAVHIIPISPPVPGFNFWNTISYTNLGTTSTSGTLTFVKDSHLNIVNVSQSGIVNNATGFTYSYSNLAPNETRNIYVTMSVPAIPAVNINDVLTNNATITAGTNEVNLQNNYSSVSQIVVASWDPNDKMEAHGEQILISNFTTNDYLYYTIRFENTGTASATNVILTDLLDSKLDETSIKMVEASNPYILTRNNNLLTWYFNEINLPVSIANTLIGKGYVTFKIKPKTGYSVGDIIPNSASIYFDANPAIVTNTFNTEFVSTLAINEFVSENFMIYPNPTTGLITVASPDSALIKSIKVYDISGKLVYHNHFNDTILQTIDLSEINSGVYFMEIQDEFNAKQIKKIIVK